SVKTEDGKYMYIKASGTALKDMCQERGWRRLRIEPVLAIIKDRSLNKLDAIARENTVVTRLLDACDDCLTCGARPSVESHLHALLLSHVIHLHPLVVSAYVNARDGQAQIARLFAGEKLPPLWVPYADPGYMLARKIAGLVADYQQEHRRKPQILFLEKHGVFVTADSANAALRLVRKVIERCESKLKIFPSPGIKAPASEDVAVAKLAIRKAVFDVTGQYVPVSHYPATAPVAAFMAHRDCRALLAAPALHPEELVFANGPALWVEDTDPARIARGIQSRLARTRKAPYAFIAKGLGLFIAADKSLAPLAAEMANGSVTVRMHAHRFGGVFGLSRREQEFINNWESEAFRKKLVGGEGPGELSNRIAVVTGAGSGLGRSIAVGLARAGALVALTDIDEKAGRETADIIARERSKNQAKVIPCNVTSEDSVRAAFQELLAHWGGLDILVNAAGTTERHPAEEFPAEVFDRILDVNLRSVFLLTQKVGRVMIAQRSGKVINVASVQSELSGRNIAPYTVSKGGIRQLTKALAAEW
ncbi:MAG: SDR family NAD(P)-dependent oxidoreductase, partial [Acidobacteria bacterium]